MDSEVNLRIFENYQSPFKIIIPKLKCNNPSDHAIYPTLHKDVGNCPAHNPLEQRRQHDARFAWEAWTTQRERYATAEPGTAGDDQRATAMYLMLDYVSLENPPYAPSVVVTRRPSSTYANMTAFLTFFIPLGLLFLIILFAAVL